MTTAVLSDLYDTLVTAAWDELDGRWADRVDIDRRAFADAYAQTGHIRGTGALGSLEDDVAALLDACGASHPHRTW